MSIWILKQLRTLILAIISGAEPRQLALGLLLGLIWGLLPSVFLLKVVLLVMLLFFKVNLSMAFLGIGLSLLFVGPFSQLMHALGYFVLVDVAFMEALLSTVFSWPIVAYFRLNNTVVFGTLLFFLLFSWPLYIGFCRGIVVFRLRVIPVLSNSFIVRPLKASKWVQRILQWLS